MKKKIIFMLIAINIVHSSSIYTATTPAVPITPKPATATLTESTIETHLMEAAEASVKIRCFDVYKVCSGMNTKTEKWEGSHQWKDELQAIADTLMTRNNDIQIKIKNYTKKESELQSTGNSLNADARDKKKKELANAKADIEIEIQSMKELEQEMQQEAQMRILTEIDKIVDEIFKEQNIDILLSGGIAKVKSKFDISEDIAKRMNEQYDKKKKKLKPAPASIDTKKTGASIPAA